MTKKCAYIRSNDEKRCPFGLPITSACKCAGSSVKRMVPIEDADPDEEETEKTIVYNKIVLNRHKDGERCMYADNIIEKSDKVDCDYGDTGAGIGDAPLASSPLHVSPLSQGVDGIYSYPLGLYSDNNESRNLFYALFSLLGEKDSEDALTKLASCVGKDSDFIISLQKEFCFLKKNYDDNMKLIKNSLELKSEDEDD